MIGSFWMRLLVFSILALPFSYCIYRFKVRQEIENELHRTICPVCGRAGEEPVGTKRECGEGLVPQSAMKWIDEDDPGHSV